MEYAKLNYIIFSEETILSKNNTLSLVNIFEKINTVSLPAVHPKLCVSINIDILDDITHELKIKILDKNSNLLIEGGVFSVKRNSSDNSKIQMVNTFINTIFKEDGDYSVVCLLDNKKLGEKKLSVVKIVEL